MPTISLNIIVKNEQKFIEGCLESIKGMVDEIILGDTGSEDDTLDIAKKYTSKIINIEWKNNFAEARNIILKNSSCDWILYLDADERIEKVYHDMIKEMIKIENVDAYLLLLRSLVNTENGQQMHIVPYPRLFRNIPGLMFEGRIHEQITPSLVLKNANIKKSSVIIEHLGYSQEKEILKRKKKRNLDALLEQTQDEPENSYAFFQLAQTYLVLNQQDKGKEALLTAIELGTLTPPISASAHASLAQYYFSMKEYDLADKFCSDSLCIAPNQIYGRLLRAEILTFQNKFDEALNEMSKVLGYLKIPEKDRFSEVAVEVNYNLDFVYYKIGKLYLYQNKPEKAAQYFKESIQFNPDFEESKSELASIYFMKKEYDNCCDILSKINYSNIVNVSLLMTIAGFYEEMKKIDECATVLKRVITLDSDNAKAHFFLGNCYLTTNSFALAEEHFGCSSRLAPTVPEPIQNLAFIYIKQKSYPKAYEEFLKLKKLLPEDQNVQKKILALESLIDKKYFNNT